MDKIARQSENQKISEFPVKVSIYLYLTLATVLAICHLMLVEDCKGSNMIAGNTARFAIEFDIKLCTDNWVFGVFYYWVNGIRFGNPDDSVHLIGSIGWAKDFLCSPPNLINQSYYRGSEKFCPNRKM